MSLTDFSNEHSPETLDEELPTSHRTLMASIYCKLVSYENHYNLIQNKYKALATTWILATFIGIGYLLSGMEVAIPVNIFVAILFVCLLSAEGIALLWFLDTKVYYKLIEAIFTENLILEKKYKYLGKSHQNILRLHNVTKDPLYFLGMFYSSFIFFLLLIGVVSLSFYLYEVSKIYVIATFIAIIFYVVFYILLHHKHKIFLND